MTLRNTSMDTEYKIILFYKFLDITDTKKEVELHTDICKTLHLTGRILIGEEGINATLEGTTENIDKYKAFLKNDIRYSDMVVKENNGTGKAFPKLAVKIRKEIVTLGAGKFDIEKETAKQLPAHELQKWYEKNEDFYVLDLRNDYEISVGKFDRTINPNLSHFRDLNDKLQALSPLKKEKIVAVCTYGIRCEKATCLLKRAGFSDIYQLQDGIGTYIKEFPNQNFKGKLFVFDNRMTDSVSDEQKSSIIGKCEFCHINAEKYYSDDTTRPSRKIIACADCAKKEALHLRDSSSTKV